MIKIKSSPLYLILVMMLCGCSVDISQISGATSTPPGQALSTTPGASVPSGSNPTQHRKFGNPSLPSTTIPVTWGNLGLTGTLVYQSSIQNGNSLIMSIQALDLVTGDITTIFQAPNTAWIDFASVSPDGKELVMAYLPPRNGGSSTTSGEQALYTMPMDGSQPPQILIQPPGNGDQYFQP